MGNDIFSLWDSFLSSLYSNTCINTSCHCHFPALSSPSYWLLTWAFCLTHIMLIWYCWKLNLCFLLQWRLFMFLVCNKNQSAGFTLNLWACLRLFIAFLFPSRTRRRKMGQNEVSGTWIIYVHKFNLITKSGKAFH